MGAKFNTTEVEFEIHKKHFCTEKNSLFLKFIIFVQTLKGLNYLLKNLQYIFKITFLYLKTCKCCSNSSLQNELESFPILKSIYGI